MELQINSETKETRFEAKIYFHGGHGKNVQLLPPTAGMSQLTLSVISDSVMCIKKDLRGRLTFEVNITEFWSEFQI